MSKSYRALASAANCTNKRQLQLPVNSCGSLHRAAGLAYRAFPAGLKYFRDACNLVLLGSGPSGSGCQY